MPNLDLVMTGDCISAVTALGNTERAVRSLQSRAGSGVGVAVSVGGARAAQKDLAGVGSALSSTSAAAQGFNRTPIAGGMVAGAAAARGLSSSLSGTNRAMGEARSGAGALAAAGAASTRSLGSMAPVVAGMTSRLGAMGRAAGAVAALPVAVPGGRGGGASIMAASHGVDRFRTALAAQQLQAARGLPVMAAANAQTAALAANATSAAGAVTRLGGAPLMPPGHYTGPGSWDGGRRFGGSGIPDTGARAPGPYAGMPGAWDNGHRIGSGAPPVVPPVVPPGRGGGGGGGDDDAERRGAAAGKAGAEIGKGIGTMLMAGLAVGIATNASYAKHALDAVNVTISETPGLADKATEAADELGAGIRDITAGVNMDRFADQFERLGTANRALGQMQGQIGMQNLATKLETEARSADVQTRALARMAPAFDAAIRGSSNLGDALLTGISNPQVVNGVRALGESLSKPEIAKGLADITTGAAASSLVFAKLAADVSGAVSSVVNSVVGGQNVTDMSGALFGGSAVAALAKGGLGARLGAGVLGGSAVFGSQQLMAQGRDDLVTPSLINELLGSAAGYRLGAMVNPRLALPAMLAGGLGAQYGTQAAAGLPGALGKAAPAAMMGGQLGLLAGSALGPLGMAAGTAAGTAVGGAVGVATDPTSKPEDKGLALFGGTLLGDAFTGGGVSKAAGQGLAQTFPQGAPAGPGAVAPGPQQPEAPKGQVGQLLERQKATQQRVAEDRRSRGLRPAGSGSAPPAPIAPAAPAADTSAAANATQQLSQNAQQATQSVQGLGASMPQVAQHAANLPASFAPVQHLPAQANAQMNTAAASISQSAQQVGAAIPPAISTGIVKQTPKVCDAAADMGNSMVNCTGRALQTASPSKKFIALGESTGDGAAIGVNNSAGGAVDAVGSMASGMLSAVGALGSGVEAASEGAVPIAESGGLMVGYVWARSVATGVDSVLKSADFAQASMPAINSALAKTTLGRLGLLGVAGSGASISKTAGGGRISMPAPVVNATFQVSVDGTPLQVIAQRQIDGAMDALADSFSRQRG